MAFRFCDRCGHGRWLSLILCLSLLISPSPLAAGAGFARSAVETAPSAVGLDTSATSAVAQPDGEVTAAPLPQGTVLGLVVNAAGTRPWPACRWWPPACWMRGRAIASTCRCC